MNVEELVKQIESYDHYFWNMNEPLVSDIEYDKEVERLRKFDPDNNYFKSIPKQTIGAAKKKKHTIPMRSLDKLYSWEEIIEWCAKVSRNDDEKFSLEPKHDGVSVDKEGDIISTRGNGTEGEVITDKTPLVEVLTNEYYGPIEGFNSNIRGELIMRKSVFESNQHRMLRKKGEMYKIPRTACVGLLGQDIVDESLGKVLTLIDFSYKQQVMTLEELTSFNCKKYIDEVKNSDFPADGLVVKLYDQEYSKSLGFTTHHPKGQMAFKFGNPTGITILKRIDFKCGKKSITPVGIVEPVIIEGINNSKISLHNWKYVVDNDLFVGDQIEIERCGDIIPQFKRIVKKGISQEPFYPDVCPECGGKVIYEEPELKCINPSCGGSMLQCLIDSVVRIGIDRLGEPTIKNMMDMYRVETLKDIFNLSYPEIRNLPGQGDKSAELLFNEIDKVRKSSVPDWKILSSLNLDGIGSTISKKILSKKTLDELIKSEYSDLIELPNIGEERAKVLHELSGYILKTYLSEFVDIFDKVIISKQDESVIKQKVCFTGKSDHPRKYWVELAERNGFEFDKSVHKDTNFLVTNDIGGKSNKMKNAEKYGLIVMDYESFLKELA